MSLVIASALGMIFSLSVAATLVKRTFYEFYRFALDIPFRLQEYFNPSANSILFDINEIILQI